MAIILCECGSESPHRIANEREYLYLKGQALMADLIENSILNKDCPLWSELQKEEPYRLIMETEHLLLVEWLEATDISNLEE